ncbi:MAG: response regulator [Planctomycetota bacterium]|jgi:CheY-like chemotaxis protein
MYDIVAVDDAPVIRGLLEKIFKMLKWNAVIFENPIEALEVIEKDGTRVLMTDINMPGMDGATFARKIREQYPKMPIIALTASVGEMDLNPADFTCVLSKPFGVSHLTQVLTNYLAMAKYTISEDK